MDTRFETLFEMDIDAGLGESRGAKENFELFRGWKLKRRGSYRRGGVFIWVDKSNNLYPL